MHAGGMAELRKLIGRQVKGEVRERVTAEMAGAGWWRRKWIRIRKGALRRRILDERAGSGSCW